MEQVNGKPTLVDFREAYEIQTSTPKVLYELSRAVVEMSSKLGDQIRTHNRQIINAPIELTAAEVHNAYGLMRDKANMMHNDLTNWYTGWNPNYKEPTNAQVIDGRGGSHAMMMVDGKMCAVSPKIG